MTLNMFLDQPCCICIKEDNFDLKGSETDVTGILRIYSTCTCIISEFTSPEEKGAGMVKNNSCFFFSN